MNLPFELPKDKWVREDGLSAVSLQGIYTAFWGIKHSGGFMDRFTCSPFVDMGINLGSLANNVEMNHNYTHNDLARDVVFLLKSLNGWVNDNLFSAPSSKIGAGYLAAKLSQASSSEFLEKNGAEVVDKKQLISELHHFATILASDLNIAASYVITEKRARNMDYSFAIFCSRVGYFKGII